MRDFVFRDATDGDAEEILALYDSVRNEENCTWDEEYPCRANIEEDLAAQCLFVAENDGEIIGAISINPENELDETVLWQTRANAMELARVAVKLAYRKQGVGLGMVIRAQRIAFERGAKCIHLLVAQKNIAARRNYEKAGYASIGSVHSWGEDYFAMEKPLNDL